MTRKRLPAKPVLELDEKLVNLLRYYQMIDDELEKLQKPIYVSSMMDEIRAIEEMIVERLRWLFPRQVPSLEVHLGLDEAKQGTAGPNAREAPARGEAVQGEERLVKHCPCIAVAEHRSKP